MTPIARLSSEIAGEHADRRRRRRAQPGRGRVAHGALLPAYAHLSACLHLCLPLSPLAALAAAGAPLSPLAALDAAAHRPHTLALALPSPRPTRRTRAPSYPSYARARLLHGAWFSGAASGVATHLTTGVTFCRGTQSCCACLGQRGSRHVYACDFSRYVVIRGAMWRYVAIGRDRSRSGGGARETEYGIGPLRARAQQLNLQPMDVQRRSARLWNGAMVGMCWSRASVRSSPGRLGRAPSLR